MINKKILIGMFFVSLVLSVAFVSSASFSSPQLSIPGSSSLSSLGVSTFPSFSSESCKAGQDFAVQIAPFGCEPKVVRSDLLEEQNVPVFCQLAATQINPLIKVDAIDSISFKGNYPNEVAGVGFYPAQAAIKSTNSKLLNSPILANIGYAVIVLKQQVNESSMPDSVRGDLTATIKYDIETAFGVGSATYYLPELTGSQWGEKFAQYSFWNGKGFLRAEAIDTDNAQISIYRDKDDRISTFKLKKGETSSDVYLPGLYCRAGLKVRLDGLENPDTRAKFNINNGNVVEAGEKQKFLENKCEVRSLDKQGLVQSVEVRCSTDTGTETFTLKISPKIKLDFEGASSEGYSIGDFLYKEGDLSDQRSVYLGYIGTKGGSNKEEDLFVYLVALPNQFALNKQTLTDSELSTTANIAKGIEGSTGKTVSSFFSQVGRFISSGSLQFYGYVTKGEAWTRVPQEIDPITGLPKVEKKVKVRGKEIEVGGFIVRDNPIVNVNTKSSYDSAIKDYKEILTQFPNEKETSLSTETYGEKALEQMIILSNNLGQNRKVVDFCKELDERYPDSSAKPDACRNALETSNTAVSKNSVSINGNVKEISFKGISEPTFDDYGAVIRVKSKEGTQDYSLRKNQIQYLNSEGTQFMQLVDLEKEEAKINLNFGVAPTGTTTTSFTTGRSEKQVLEAVVKEYGSNSACKNYVSQIVKEANTNGIDPLLLMALMIQESSCKSLPGDGGAGAVGLMQITQVTYDEMCKGKSGLGDFSSVKNNDANNIKCGAMILNNKYNTYKNGAVFKKKESATIASCFRDSDTIYSGWEAAVRGYVGWGCPKTGSDDSKKNHDNYVESVVEKFKKLTVGMSTSTSKLDWPLTTKPFIINSCTGERTCTGCSSPHAGIDIKAGQGEPVYSVAEGKVITVGGTFGEVKIEHTNGIVTRYLHNSKVIVNNGDKVNKGDKIAEVGGAGVDGPSTYPAHLHFEVYENGKIQDPLLYFDRIGLGLKYDINSNCVYNIKNPDYSRYAGEIQNNVVRGGTSVTWAAVEGGISGVKGFVAGIFSSGSKTIEKATTSLPSGTRTLKKGVLDDLGTKDYTFSIVNINLKKVAKVSLAPNVKNAGTEANFSFQVNIDKRAIQLSPETIKKRIDALNESIDKWEGTSEALGKVVKTFNAACLLTGTALTLKNLAENTDGKSIARQEVMRGPEGYRERCAKEIKTSGKTIDKCLLDYNDQIERDVVERNNQMKAGTAPTTENAPEKFNELKSSSNIDCKIYPNACKIFTPDDLKNNRVTLTQMRDLQTNNNIINSPTASAELKAQAKESNKRILTQIEKNSKTYVELKTLSTTLEGKVGKGIDVIQGGDKNAISGKYNNFKTDKELGNIPKGSPVQGIIWNNKNYILVLAPVKGGNYMIKSVHDYSNGNQIDDKDANVKAIKARYAKGFKLSDASSYNNPFKVEPVVQFYEDTKNQGLPAIVPFDTVNGWYAATRASTFGGGTISPADKSGRVTSFWICNVGENGKPDFNGGDSLVDDECALYNPGLGVVQELFPNLGVSASKKLVSDAQRAISDAQRQYKVGLTGTIKINGKQIKVGTPAAIIPTTQCSDFMSSKDCNILFNVCDPVVCPSSRCNLGGQHTVPNVIQSGIVGSIALCLPNIKEDIYVPICLSGVKAGLDGYVSVQKSYRECLQENLATGKTVGICDQMHSVYLCDFFWKQAGPVSEFLVPSLIDFASGKTGSRGGGEYLGFSSAWKNAGASVDYMTQYYGANLFATFRARFQQEISTAICKGFISGTMPSVIDSLIEPRSPVQFTAYFSESTFTTATVPATSQYKVFYHIYAGENNEQNSGAFYSVYLKATAGTSSLRLQPTLAVASGYAKKGEYATETKDFTAPTGYKEVCVNVNGQEQCGFGKVTTEFAINYLNDLAIKEQGSQTDIKTEKECISGTPTLYGLINPNLQSGVENSIDPQLYNQGIVRVCATSPPGKGTEPGRWLPVGTCDNGKGDINCYLDKQSVKDVIKTTSIEEETLKEAGAKLEEELKKSGILTESDFDKLIKKILELRKEKEYQKIISEITEDILKKAFWNFQKAKLYLFRGDAHGGLAGEGKVATTTPSGTGTSGTGTGGSGTTTGVVEPIIFLVNKEKYNSVLEEITIKKDDDANEIVVVIGNEVVGSYSLDKKIIINVESGVKVNSIGEDMYSGEINIKKGVIIKNNVGPVIGKNMVGGKIIINEGVLSEGSRLTYTNITNGEELKLLTNSENLDRDLVVFIPDLSSFIP